MKLYLNLNISSVTVELLKHITEPNQLHRSGAIEAFIPSSFASKEASEKMIQQAEHEKSAMPRGLTAN